MEDDRHIETFTIDWQGITLSVSYEADWLNMTLDGCGLNTAHLQVRSINPERAPNPVSETGYRSLFIGREMIEDAGGPVAFAQNWLDASAKSTTLRNRTIPSSQLSLF